MISFSSFALFWFSWFNVISSWLCVGECAASSLLLAASKNYTSEPRPQDIERRCMERGDSDKENDVFTWKRMRSSFPLFLSPFLSQPLLVPFSFWFSWTLFRLWHFSIFAAFSSRCGCVLSPFISTFHLLACLDLLLFAQDRAYTLMSAPLKWFFDMLDNEHLIMLTCVYY